jgi:protoporphyrinogen oxidase
MLQTKPEDASQKLNNLVSFTGRKKLFDQEKSMKLKENKFFDEILAAKKKYVGEPRYNLYPKSGNLEDIRLAIEEALISNNVEIILNQEIENIDLKENNIILANNRSINFDNIVFADNIAKTEAAFKKSKKISEKTFALPQVFYFMEVDKKQLPKFNYIMNYDLSHISSRFTNFGNYASPFDRNTGIVCAEVPTKINSEIWNNKDSYVSKIIAELNEVYNNDINVLSIISVRIKSTYKIPLVGYENEVNNLINEIKNKNYNNNVIVPDPYILTRKHAIDSLMPFFA